MIVLDYVNKWNEVALPLLDRFAKAEVIIQAGFAVAVRKFPAMWNEYKKLHPQKKVATEEDLSNTLSGIKEDLVLKPTEPFHGIALKRVDLGVSLTNWTNAPMGSRDPTIVLSGSRNVTLLEGMKAGYLAMTVPMGVVVSSQKEDSITNMLTWITGGGTSKIRITCHGDGEGNLEMQGQRVSAAWFAKWFSANGLLLKGNLTTISLNICMAAKYNLTPAVIQNGRYSPAEGSAVALLAKALGDLGLKGIKVTGSNENVGAEQPATLTREYPQGAEIQNSQAYRAISIPTGFGFDKQSYTLTLPAGWTFLAKKVGDSDLWSIQAPTNYVVTTVTSRYQVPQVGGVSKDVSQVYGEYAFTDPRTQDKYVFLMGWIVDQVKKEALSGAGWKRLDDRRIQFTGTGGSFVLQTAGTSIQIVERLAHSGAKAIAYS